MAQTAPVRGGDVDYDRTGGGYAALRRPDPRIAALIWRALGDSRRVINVGAGAGSYEPTDRLVVPVEPSATMRGQRPRGLAPAVRAWAEALPFDDGAFDAAMAILTVHQWADKAAGLREVRRVTRGPIVVMCFDPDEFKRYWLIDYVPELDEADRRRSGTIAEMKALLAPISSTVEVIEVPIAIDCTDGFTEAYYARPERLLEASVRGAQSVWGFVPPGTEERFVARLSADLASGAWDAKYGAWRTRPEFVGALRLVVAR
ncbi:MAG: methyltransferase domain-containing protein [Planctomycetota bacterium]|nr:methyltransferase domain-containing protein [Planctomycetota bacterium]